ncbi:DUF4272 domain-containing protein [Corynebacterium macclintockiae]|uniref:DUF4272 domain-containing protein n=1 Tax=Corynebacterium macclintockiae TaxID=2913501 RepID=UPI003EBEAD3F
MSIYVNAYSTVRADVPFQGAGAPAIASRELCFDSPAQPYLKTAANGAGEEDDKQTLELLEHLAGFAGYAAEQGEERFGNFNSYVLAVVQHIRSVRRHYVFEREDDFDFSHLGEFADWAREANAVFFLADGTVRNASGADLLDPALVGSSPANGAQANSVPRHPGSEDRMRRVRGALWRQGYQVAPTLPPVRSEAEILLRPAEEVFNRAVALSVVATAAASVLRGEAVNFAALRAGAQRTFGNLTKVEQAFLERVEAAQESADEATGAPTYSQDLQEDAYQLAWAYTASEFLAWALGLMDIDVFSFTPVDLAALRSALRGIDRENQDAAALPMRSLSEICEAFEYIYSLRWVSVEQQLETSGQAGVGQTGSAQLQPQDHSILVERHRALAWLTDPTIAYDDVDLST